MDDDLFITGAEARELRDAVERRAAVIRILESDLREAERKRRELYDLREAERKRRELYDLREAERKRRELYDLLARICKEEQWHRCGVLENCRDCAVKKTLEECK